MKSVLPLLVVALSCLAVVAEDTNLDLQTDIAVGQEVDPHRDITAGQEVDPHRDITAGQKEDLNAAPAIEPSADANVDVVAAPQFDTSSGLEFGEDLESSAESGQTEEEIETQSEESEQEDDEDEGLAPFDEINPEKGPDGEEMVEGDMLFDKESEEETRGGGILNRRYYWPRVRGYPTIYYMFHKSSVGDKNRIVQALKTWIHHTCIRFRYGRRMNPFIVFFKGRGCWSYVGRRIGKTYQPISIGRGCNSRSTIEHEVGHAVGFLHEQSRIDRDKYVRVLWENIKRGYARQFKKYRTRTDVPYDYTSVMHYGQSYFSKNRKPTLVTLKRRYQSLIENRKHGLSYRDLFLANKMYKCIDLWKARCRSRAPKCLHGYVGKNCKCKCPPGKAGSTCGLEIGGYYRMDNCGKIITKPTLIKSPGYPKFHTWRKCGFYIKNKKCKGIKVIFWDFNALYRYKNKKCYWDFMDIRVGNLLKKRQHIYCGNELRRKTVYYRGKEMFIEWFAHGYAWYKRRGFKATVTFYGC